jgi:hypothetical protein
MPTLRRIAEASIRKATAPTTSPMAGPVMISVALGYDVNLYNDATYAFQTDIYGDDRWRRGHLRGN